VIACMRAYRFGGGGRGGGERELKVTQSAPKMYGVAGLVSDNSGSANSGSCRVFCGDSSTIDR
jgi:hypothetical protein